LPAALSRLPVFPATPSAYSRRPDRQCIVSPGRRCPARLRSLRSKQNRTATERSPYLPRLKKDEHAIAGRAPPRCSRVRQERGSQMIEEQLELIETPLERSYHPPLKVFDTVTVRVGYKTPGKDGRPPRCKTLVARVVDHDAGGEVLGYPLASGLDLFLVVN